MESTTARGAVRKYIAMDWIEFLHPERSVYFAILLVLVLFLVWKAVSNPGKLKHFVGDTMQPRLVVRATMGRHILQILCIAVSGIGFILALMQPQIIQKEHKISARDAANIFVAMDVSKSMLATDVAPNRLERAKSEVRDMIMSFSTDRVGLLAFAGRTTVLSPLTMDHGFFRNVLNSASPTSVTMGGTNIGEVIRKGTQLLKDQEGPKAMILISDGEDHDSYPVEVAEEARRAGIVIVTVGFGSETGSTIDVLDKFTGKKTRITDSDGHNVISKLDSEMLKQIALKTNGVYVPAGTGVLDLESIMRRVILPLVEDSDQEKIIETRVELYPWFVLFGMVFFLGFILLEGSGLKSTRISREKTV